MTTVLSSVTKGGTTDSSADAVGANETDAGRSRDAVSPGDGVAPADTEGFDDADDVEVFDAVPCAAVDVAQRTAISAATFSITATLLTLGRCRITVRTVLSDTNSKKCNAFPLLQQPSFFSCTFTNTTHRSFQRSWVSVATKLVQHPSAPTGEAARRICTSKTWSVQERTADWGAFTAFPCQLRRKEGACYCCFWCLLELLR
jgi:hypothetical protein